MSERVYIRASSLPSYMDCPRRGAAKLFRKEIEGQGYDLSEARQSIGAATGQGCHSSVGYMLEQKIETGDLGNKSEADDRAIGSLRQECENGVVFDQITPNMNTAEKQVLRQTAVYRLDLAPKVEPVSVEEYFEGNITFRAPDGREVEVTLTGHVDAREVSRIRDLKTGRHRQNIAQYGGYSLLARSRGHDITELVEDFVPRTSIKRPQGAPEPHVYDVGKGEQTAYQLLKRMALDLDQFRQDADPWAFMPNPMSMMCSDKYCPAWGTEFCRAHVDPDSHQKPGD